MFSFKKNAIILKLDEISFKESWLVIEKLHSDHLPTVWLGILSRGLKTQPQSNLSGIKLWLMCLQLQRSPE